jgi:uncharacterized protein (TIGR02271 family)
MSLPAGTVVLSEDGLRGVIEDVTPHPGGMSGLVPVRLEGGALLWIREELLTPAGDGGYRLAAWLSGDRVARAPSQPGCVLQVPVVAERLIVGKRLRDAGGVRVRKTVREREEEADVPLRREEIAVERRPVGRLVDGPVAVREEDGVLIVPVLEEVLVVEKRLVLREELHIRKLVHEERRPERHVLRSEEVIVEDLPPRDPQGG